LAELQPGETWADNPSLVTTPDRNLHLVWVCGVQAHRCYRMSNDSGRTWSPTQRILGNLLSRAGGDTMVADHQGTVHLLAQLRDPTGGQPQGIYYANRSVNNAWSQPVLIIDEPGFEDAHFLQATISAGNQLHAVWQKSAQEGDVVHTRITTSSAPVSPLTTPAARGTPSVTTDDLLPTGPTSTNTEEPGSSPTPLRTPEPAPVSQSGLPAQTLVWAVVPSVILVGLVAGWRLRRRLWAK
jgi:hypothetical protein